jgi:hypothetical protein
MNMLEQSVVHRRQDYLPPAFLIDTVTLECQLDIGDLRHDHATQPR